MNGIDPDIQAAFGSAPVSQPTTPQVDADVEAAFKPAATSVTVPSKFEQEAEDERAAETGAGEVALHLGTGAAAAIPAGVAYLGGALGIGKGSLENARAVQQALTYQPRTPQGQGALQGLGMVAGAPGRWATKQIDTDIEPSGQLSAALSDIAERTMDVAPFLGEGVAALNSTGLTRAIASPKSVPQTEPHPLQGAANVERQNLSDVRTRLGQQGITIADNPLSPVVRNSNNVIARELDLPIDAPITEGMLEAGIKHHALPAYTEARTIAPWEASPAYETDVKGINTNLIDEDIRPPASGDLDGKETVRLSQNLRNRATAYYKASEMNPAFRPVAAAHEAAAEAIENEFERHTADVPGMSEAWDNARTYIAKAKNVEAALDGAGNVRPTMLRAQMMKGKYMTGGIQDLAIGAALDRGAFPTNPTVAAPVSLPRRIASRVVTPLTAAGGAAVGAHLGIPTLGAAVGGEGGAKLSTLLNPNQR